MDGPAHRRTHARTHPRTVCVAHMHACMLTARYPQQLVEHEAFAAAVRADDHDGRYWLRDGCQEVHPILLQRQLGLAGLGQHQRHPTCSRRRELGVHGCHDGGSRSSRLHLPQNIEVGCVHAAARKASSWQCSLGAGVPLRLLCLKTSKPACLHNAPTCKRAMLAHCMPPDHGALRS